MAVDHIRRGPDANMRAYLDGARFDPQLEEALRKGDVDKILQALPAGITRDDIEEYLKHRAVILEQVVLQNYQIKADEGAVPPPSPVDDLLPIDAGNALSVEDRQYLQAALGLSGDDSSADSQHSWKGAQVLRAGDTDQQEAADAINQHADDVHEFVSESLEGDQELLLEVQNQIFNIQLTMELQSKRAELRKELDRIIALMRSGMIDPEFVLVALAKVQVSERGTIFTQLGRKAMHINEEQSRLAREIGVKDGLGGIETTKVKMQKETVNLNQVISSMNKVTQDIDSIFSMTKTLLEEYTRTKLELIRRAAVSGA